jgi:hypothetical protein
MANNLIKVPSVPSNPVLEPFLACKVPSICLQNPFFSTMFPPCRFGIQNHQGKLSFDRIKEKMYDDETKDLTERMQKNKDYVDEDIYSLPLGQPPITDA